MMQILADPDPLHCRKEYLILCFNLIVWDFIVFFLLLEDCKLENSRKMSDFASRRVAKDLVELRRTEAETGFKADLVKQAFSLF
jgi:hypothetical protein